jgi:hypothetical protein
MIALTKSQLGLTDAVVAQLTAQLSNAANPDPLTDAINRATQIVRDYTLRYVLEDERQARLIRALTLWDVFTNPQLGSQPPQAMQTAYKAAMQELQDIRDGKFHDLLQANPEDPQLSPALGEWGSDRKVHFGRGDCD